MSNATNYRIPTLVALAFERGNEPWAVAELGQLVDVAAGSRDIAVVLGARDLVARVCNWIGDCGIAYSAETERATEGMIRTLNWIATDIKISA
jgi:hypothetical protein